MTLPADVVKELIEKTIVFLERMKLKVINSKHTNNSMIVVA
ncbi:MAG: hypothetical protein M0T73_06060 [Deltaproteobacteria bacterium]|nr:hypothetical protein [Deltaproteobacteria bacterium]